MLSVLNEVNTIKIKIMNKYKLFIISVTLLFTLHLSAKEYNASLFGVKSDGVTLNTGSIQYAIDFISENGGGTLSFYVGRYLTGSFHLKSNVTIELKEGAVLVAFPSIYDYYNLNETNALILGDNVENIGIKGDGVIVGNGKEILKSIREQIQKGYLEETEAKVKPAMINFNGCSNVIVDGIILRDACGDFQVYSSCNNIKIYNITVESASIPNTNGIVLTNGDGFSLVSSFVDVSGKEISLQGDIKNISIENCINGKGVKIKGVK